MRVAFVGSVTDPDSQQKLSASSTAGNKYQFGLLQALADLGVRVRAISLEPHAMWRRWGDRFIVAQESQRTSDNLSIHRVAFVNIVVFKQFCVALNTFLALVVWRLQSPSRGSVIIVYNTLSYQLIPAYLASRLLRCPLGVLVADLPLDDVGRGPSARLRAIESSFEVRGLACAEFVIALSRHTISDFAVSVPSLVVEGGQVDVPLREDEGPRGGNQPHQLVYAGSLNSVSGIDLAIDAVRVIPAGRVVLHIFGSGTPDQISAVKALESESVIFHGAVPHGQVIEIQRRADALLSPRRPDAFVTRYTFPSKVLEGLVSGVPLVSNRLPGIPEEYYEFLNVPDAPEAESWALTIQQVCDDKGGAFADRARQGQAFVATHKTWDQQAHRVATFLQAIS